MIKTTKKSGWIKLGSSPSGSNLPISKKKLNKGRSWAQITSSGIKTKIKISKVSLKVDIDFKVRADDFEKMYPDIYTSVVNLKGSKIRIKKESPSVRAPVNIEVHIDVKRELVDRIYPDILIVLINFMNLGNYLDYVSNSDLYNKSLLNSPFLKYLEVYFPDERKYLIENKSVVLRTHRKLDPKSSYLIYEIHQILYPEYYEDEGVYEDVEENKYPNEYEIEDVFPDESELF